MPRLLQYKSDRGTLQYRIKFILACPRDARLMTYTGEMEIGWFDYLTGDNQPTDPAMKARFKDNLKKEPLVKSVIALVKAEAIKLGDNLETGLKKCMLCGYSMLAENKKYKCHRYFIFVRRARPRLYRRRSLQVSSKYSLERS